MKAKLLRDEEITHPRLKSVEDVVAWRAKLDREEITPFEWRQGMFLKVAAGTVIDHPHAHRLVMMGMAEPADQECTDMVKRLKVDVDAAAEGQDRTRGAQLTGDATFDRDAGTELHEELEDLDGGTLTDSSNEPKIIVANKVLEVALPPDTNSSAPLPLES